MQAWLFDPCSLCLQSITLGLLQIVVRHDFKSPFWIQMHTRTYQSVYWHLPFESLHSVHMQTFERDVRLSAQLYSSCNVAPQFRSRVLLESRCGASCSHCLSHTRLTLPLIAIRVVPRANIL